MKEFILKPGMKVKIKKTAEKEVKDADLSFVKFSKNNPRLSKGTLHSMSINLGLYGKIIKTSACYDLNDTSELIVINHWCWPLSAIDKSKPVIDLAGNKVYVQKRKLVLKPGNNQIY